MNFGVGISFESICSLISNTNEEISVLSSYLNVTVNCWTNLAYNVISDEMLAFGLNVVVNAALVYQPSNL